MEKSIGFIGAGRITRIILQAISQQGFVPGTVIVHDLREEIAAETCNQYPFVRSGSLGDAAACDIIFLAIHPPVIMETLQAATHFIRPEAKVVSLAPKITLGRIASVVGRTTNLARLIPNATSIINEGYNPVCFSDSFDDKDDFMALLSLLGKTFETDESKLEGYAILSAMLPTYFWFQWNELVSIGLQTGLSETECNECLEQTLHAAVNTLFRSGKTPGEVIDLIPVKPIADHEGTIREMFRTSLLPLYNKIKP